MLLGKLQRYSFVLVVFGDRQYFVDTPKSTMLAGVET